MNPDRLTELENRFAWLERHVLEQDKAMLELGEELRRLRRALEALRQRQPGPDQPGEKPADGDERPPHY